MTPTALRRRPRWAVVARRDDAVAGGRQWPPREGRSARSSLDDKYVLEEGRILLTGHAGARARCCSTSIAPTAARGLTPARSISGYQGSPLGGLRPGAHAPARAARPSTTSVHVPGPQRGARRDLRLGQPARRPAAGPALRRRARHVVRQGPRPRPRGRRDPPRQLRRRRAHRRRARARRRRPELQVLDDPERVRAAARRASTCRSSSRATSRRCSTSACTASPARARRGCGPASRS